MKSAIANYRQSLRQHKAQKNHDPPQKAGRVTMKQLQKQYGDLKSVDVDDIHIRQFERIARKYHVQYKVYRCEKGKYQIFFKSPNNEAMQSAFHEFTVKQIQKESRPSVLEQIRALAAKLAPSKRPCWRDRKSGRHHTAGMERQYIRHDP